MKRSDEQISRAETMSGRVDAIFGALGGGLSNAGSSNLVSDWRVNDTAQGNGDGEASEGEEGKSRDDDVDPTLGTRCALHHEEEFNHSDRVALAFDDDKAEYFNEVMEVADDPSQPLAAPSLPPTRERETGGGEANKKKRERDTSHREGGGRGGAAFSAPLQSFCFDFSQMGKCRFGESCRFHHVLPECIKNPSKYQRYEIDWEEKEGSNSAAAAATFDFLRQLKGGGEAEKKADLNQGVVFQRRSVAPGNKPKAEKEAAKPSKPSLVSFGGEEEETPEDDPSAAAKVSFSTKKGGANRKFRKKKHAAAEEGP